MRTIIVKTNDFPDITLDGIRELSEDIENSNYIQDIKSWCQEHNQALGDVVEQIAQAMMVGDVDIYLCRDGQILLPSDIHIISCDPVYGFCDDYDIEHVDDETECDSVDDFIDGMSGIVTSLLFYIFTNRSDYDQFITAYKVAECRHTDPDFTASRVYEMLKEDYSDRNVKYSVVDDRFGARDALKCTYCELIIHILTVTQSDEYPATIDDFRANGSGFAFYRDDIIAEVERIQDNDDDNK